MVKPKPLKPNLLMNRKMFAIFKPKLSLNLSKNADLLDFGLTMLYCLNKYIHIYSI